VVLDECHKTKNPKAQRTKAVRELCKGKVHVISLSGTPIVNRPAEFHTTLSILSPERYGSFWKYAMEYCGAKHNGFGWDFSGASNTAELHEELTRTLMLRRLKADVLKDLPEKTKTVLPVNLNGNMRIYDDALREAYGVWAGMEKPDAMADIAQISKLRVAAARAKMDLCVEWIEDFLESEKKLVTFVVHHEVSDILKKTFGDKAVFLDERVPVNDRSALVERFQTDPNIRLLVGSVEVAGMGWTMTAASDAVFLEYPWTPGMLDQAGDRIHRIGQRNAVNIYYIVAQETLEEDMIELLDEKRKVLDEVLDGKETERGSILSELLKRVKEGARAHDGEE
jgi:SWI/SNF-related matrix-associated actin-dependent regulator 1 of chromatin subfamily A